MVAGITVDRIMERPIIFSAAMVQSLLAGRKTQTRRVVRGKRCPYGKPGDRLWVRETWAPALAVHGECFKYRAGGSYRCGQPQPRGLDNCTTWRPSIFMPRRAARIMLYIVAVRRERLRRITSDDIRAEGIASGSRAEFAALWDSINGDRAPWKENPAVWVLEFGCRTSFWGDSP